MENLFVQGLLSSWESALSEYWKDAVKIVVSWMIEYWITKDTLQERKIESDFMEEEMQFCFDEAQKLIV
jgi:hypothetical protein